MGRHGEPVRGATVPWELLGWGTFASVVGAGCILWFDGSWQTAGLVAGAGLLGLGAVLALALASAPPPAPRPGSSGRRRRPPP